MRVEERVVGDSVWGESKPLHCGQRGEGVSEGALGAVGVDKEVECVMVGEEPQRDEGAEGVQGGLRRCGGAAREAGEDGVSGLEGGADASPAAEGVEELRGEVREAEAGVRAERSVGERGRGETRKEVAVEVAQRVERNEVEEEREEVAVLEHGEEGEEGGEAGRRRDEAVVGEESMRRGEGRVGGGEGEHARVVRGGEAREVRGQDAVHGRRRGQAGGGDERLRHGRGLCGRWP